MAFTRDGECFVVETVTRGGTRLMPEIGIEMAIDELCRGAGPGEAAEQSVPR